MSQLLNLQAKAHPSRVLADWLASRGDGALQRAGIAQVHNSTLSAVSSDRDAMAALFDPLPSSSGVAVTDNTALKVSTVFACMTKIAGAVLQLPVHQYKLDAQGERERMQPTPLWWMLNESPDDAWTAAGWKEWIVHCWGLRGDQVTEILRDKSRAGGGVIKGLRPHHPDCVKPRRNGHRLAYDVFDEITGKAYTLDQDDVLHFTGFGFDGLRSKSVVQWAARNAIGNSLAATAYMGQTVGDGSMPQLALKYANKVDPALAESLRQAFVATYTGTSSRKFPLILSQGADVKELSIKPVDMELLAHRKLEKGDICEAFGVPPILIGDSEKTSSWGSGIEQITLGFVLYTLKPMLCRWEEELNRKLFRRAGQFVEFNLDALLRGDAKSQAEFFRAALGGPGTGDGWMSVDEVRKLKNQPPLGGDAAVPFRAQRATTQPASGATA